MIPTLVIGIGNTDRGDDAAGIEVARRVQARGRQDTEVRECGGGASSLLESWRERGRVILVDAASGAGRTAGTVQRYEAHRKPLPAGWLHASTHSWGVAEAIEIARSLGQLPAEVVVYAIEGQSFEPGAPLSAPVRTALERVEKWIVRELEGAT
jgi:hydrogenase maturation protease